MRLCLVGFVTAGLLAASADPATAQVRLKASIRVSDHVRVGVRYGPRYRPHAYRYHRSRYGYTYRLPRHYRVPRYHRIVEHRYGRVVVVNRRGHLIRVLHPGWRTYRPHRYRSHGRWDRDGDRGDRDRRRGRR